MNLIIAGIIILFEMGYQNIIYLKRHSVLEKRYTITFYFEDCVVYRKLISSFGVFENGLCLRIWGNSGGGPTTKCSQCIFIRPAAIF